MKHVKNYERFRKSKQEKEIAEKENAIIERAKNGYYYKIGKSINKSMFEMELIREGYSSEAISLINESYSLDKVDHKMIDCLYEYVKTGNESGLDLLTEELTIGGYKILPTWDDIKDTGKNLVDKGIDLVDKGKEKLKSWKDFLLNIGGVVKSIFGKIKKFFAKLWEIFKPRVIAAMKVVTKAVTGGGGATMKQAADKLKEDKGVQEMTELHKDLLGACGKFNTGEVGNTSDEAAKHLEDEVKEYSDIEDDADIERLMQESIERKGIVGKMFYSMKGYLSEGGTFQEIQDAIFEAEEKKEDLKEGDTVSYTNKEGKEVTGKIIRVEGEDAFFQSKDGGEFSKKLTDLKKSETLGSKITAGFVGDDPHKKGVFGWVVESVGFVFNPIAKLVELAWRGGTNTVLTIVSGLRRGMKNAYKYVLIGFIAGLIYHILHGKHAVEEELGGSEKTAQAAAGGVAKAVAGAAGVKESLLNEAAAVENIDLKQETVHTKGLWDNVKSMAGPLVGGMLLAALKYFFPPVKIVLEILLLAVGVFELVGAICKSDQIKDLIGPICQVQHDIHHFLESKMGGGH